MTRPLAARQLAQTRREMERDLKARDRAKLAKLRADISAATKARSERVRGVRTTCRSERLRLKREAQIARQELRDSIARMKQHARELCAVNISDARRATGDAIERAVAELQEERGYQASLKAWTRPTSCAVPRGQKQRDARNESDCEVAANLEDAGLRAVWDRVKSKIKAGSHASRTEAFLQWAHDHSADVERIQYEAEEDAVRELIRQETKMRKDLEKPGRYSKKSAVELRELLSEVPF